MHRVKQERLRSKASPMFKLGHKVAPVPSFFAESAQPVPTLLNMSIQTVIPSVNLMSCVLVAFLLKLHRLCYINTYSNTYLVSI